MNKVRILGIDLEIIWHDREDNGGNSGNQGRLNLKRGEIWVDNTQSLQQQRETLLHEIIEAINIQCDLELNHNQLSTISAVLFQVLEDNKLWNT